ncbi:MAG TPA: restriction endonuclease subunit S [Lentisphaeria bacterium]|nr:restriction endonuclease subunit S [Lentisphaeria bacterium]
MYSGDCIDVDSLSLIDIDEKEFKNNKVEYGDIFFTRSSLVKEGIAYSNVNLSYRNDLTFDGHLIRMQPCKTTTDPVFLAYLFKTSSARKQLILGGKTTTMTTIGQSDIAIVELALPSYKPEQSQIGTYFQNLDQLITLHQAKYNKLVNIKKAMLEKMFPKNGADVPEIRFKGFIDAWEKRKLGEIMNVTSVKRIHQSDWTNSGIRFLRARDIVSAYKNEEPSDYLYISENKYNEYSIISGKVKPNDLLVTGVGTIGIPLLIADDIPIYFKDGNIIWFKNENAIDGKFFFYSFINNRIQGFIKDSAGTGTVGTYTIDSGKKTPILLPKDKEQRKIGNYFQNLDKQITLHQKELEKLKNIKKACLEKMFV